MWGPTEFFVTGNLSNYDRTSRLSELDVPTLFTCGRYDEATPDTTAWYQSLLRGSEMVVFENSSHMSQLEEKEHYLEVVKQFLDNAEHK
jgi:proline iminopeptidase